jgi:hypothetical protein
MKAENNAEKAEFSKNSEYLLFTPEVFRRWDYLVSQFQFGTDFVSKSGFDLNLSPSKEFIYRQGAKMFSPPE